MTVDPGRVPVRKLKGGALMPTIGLGTFGSDRYSAAEVATAVAGALEVGYLRFDLGSVFENEVEIGQVLEGSRCSRSLVEEAIDLGLASVMFDGSRVDYRTNIAETPLAETPLVVSACHDRGISVEDELGVGGGDGGVPEPGTPKSMIAAPRRGLAQGDGTP